MTLLRMLVHDVTIVHPAETDDNGDTVRDYGEDATRVATKGRISRRSTTEVTDGREAQVSEWVLYLAGDETIGGLDAVEWRSRHFRVDGEPYPVSGRTDEVHHWEVPLRQVVG